MPLSCSEKFEGFLKKRILVVEDHAAVRQGIVETINRESDLMVCGEAEDMSLALEAISFVRPDLVLIDIQLKSSSGLSLVRILHQEHPELLTVGMTMFDPVRYEKKARAAGVCGFIVKQEGPEKLLTAIRKALFAKPLATDSQ